MCDEQYAHGQADHHCTLLDARVLDAPITDVILRCCRFTEHAEAVLAQLEAEYDTTREDARRRQRERRRLREEIDTLKQNLVLTRTPEHVGLIFERIDRRMQRLAELADTEPGGPRRVLSPPKWRPCACSWRISVPGGTNSHQGCAMSSCASSSTVWSSMPTVTI